MRLTRRQLGEGGPILKQQQQHARSGLPAPRVATGRSHATPASRRPQGGRGLAPRAGAASIHFSGTSPTATRTTVLSSSMDQSTTPAALQRRHRCRGRHEPVLGDQVPPPLALPPRPPRSLLHRHLHLHLRRHPHPPHPASRPWIPSARRMMPRRRSAGRSCAGAAACRSGLPSPGPTSPAPFSAARTLYPPTALPTRARELLHPRARRPAAPSSLCLLTRGGGLRGGGGRWRTLFVT